MHNLMENCKAVLVASPQLKNNGVATVTYADTAGWNHATLLGLIGDTDTTWDAKLTESDVSGSGYVDIAGAAITQVADTGDDQIVGIEVDLTKNRKRYLKPVLTSGNGSTGVNLAAVIILSRGDANPATAAAAGLAELIKV